MALLKKPASRYFVLAFVGLSLIGGASVTSATKNVYNNIINELLQELRRGEIRVRAVKDELRRRR